MDFCQSLTRKILREISGAIYLFLARHELALSEKFPYCTKTMRKVFAESTNLTVLKESVHLSFHAKCFLVLSFFSLIAKCT